MVVNGIVLSLEVIAIIEAFVGDSDVSTIADFSVDPFVFASMVVCDFVVVVCLGVECDVVCGVVTFSSVVVGLNCITVVVLSAVALDNE